MNSILDFFPAGQMKQKTAHEWCGPCLSCGGNDRFTVWPGRPGGGYYMCRGCDRQGGDGIQFMRKYMGMSYAEACAALEIEPKRTATSSFSARRTHARLLPARPAQTAYVPPKPEPAVMPCKEWISNSAAFLAECQRGIETAPEALLAICGRFLTPHTAQDCGIGWNPCDRYVSRAAWGLADEQGKDGKPRTKLLLPAGLVVAARRRAGVVALTVRSLEEDRQAKGRAKYRQVQGSSNVPFIAGRAGLPLLLVESALDAALVWQESFGKLAAVAFMGNMKGLDADTNAFIQAAPLLLACPDNDEGGQVAWQRWSAAYPQAVLTPAVGAKDLGDMHRAALAWPINPDIPSVMEWVPGVLAFASRNSTTYAFAV